MFRPPSSIRPQKHFKQNWKRLTDSAGKQGVIWKISKKTRTLHFFFGGGWRKNLTPSIFHLQIYSSTCCCFFLLMPPIRSSSFLFLGEANTLPNKKISPQCADVAHVMPILSQVPVGREWRKTSEKQRRGCFISNPKIGGFPCASTVDFLSAFLAAKKGPSNTTREGKKRIFHALSYAKNIAGIWGLEVIFSNK